jgi:hypothetical protein
MLWHSVGRESGETKTVFTALASTAELPLNSQALTDYHDKEANHHAALIADCIGDVRANEALSR